MRRGWTALAAAGLAAALGWTGTAGTVWQQGHEALVSGRVTEIALALEFAGPRLTTGGYSAAPGGAEVGPEEREPPTAAEGNETTAPEGPVSPDAVPEENAPPVEGGNAVEAGMPEGGVDGLAGPETPVTDEPAGGGAPTDPEQPMETAVPDEPARSALRPEPEAVSFPAEEILNRTQLRVDAAALATEPLELRLPSEGPQILILHTHGTEAYTQTPEDPYPESDLYRSTDSAYNMVGLGDLLAEELTAQGLQVIHDRELYDYPSYTGSYARSGEAVERWLARCPGIAVIIDLHRDAIGDENTVYKTQTWIGGESCAQVMLLVGTGENGLPHPDWRENLKLALRLRRAMEEYAPGLARPIDLVGERYNQHYSAGALLVEVGSSGNTLAEARRAVTLFARAVGPSLLALAGD